MNVTKDDHRMTKKADFSWPDRLIQMCVIFSIHHNDYNNRNSAITEIRYIGQNNKHETLTDGPTTFTVLFGCKFDVQ